MHAISGVGANDVWMVGDGASHWDGRAWQRYDDGLDEELWSVVVFSPTDAWVGGSHGFIAHFNGTSWDGQHLQASDISADVGFVSRRSLGRSIFKGRVFHGDGASWSEQPKVGNGGETPIEMWGSSPRDRWMVTQEGVLRDTAGRIETTTLAPGALLSHVTGKGPNDVWIGGLRRNNATLQHWDGKTWTETPSHPQSEVNSLYVDDAGTLWLGTENGCLYAERPTSVAPAP